MAGSLTAPHNKHCHPDNPLGDTPRSLNVMVTIRPWQRRQRIVHSFGPACDLKLWCEREEIAESYALRRSDKREDGHNDSLHYTTQKGELQLPSGGYTSGFRIN